MNLKHENELLHREFPKEQTDAEVHPCYPPLLNPLKRFEPGGWLLEQPLENHKLLREEQECSRSCKD